MSLVRKIFLIAAKLKFSLSMKHIMGYNNLTADAISRFQLQRFRKLAPEAHHHPITLPAQLWEL